MTAILLITAIAGLIALVLMSSSFMNAQPDPWKKKD